MKNFADRLIYSIRQRGNPLCVGLDPHLKLIPEPFRLGSMNPSAPETAEAVEQFLLAVLDRVADRVSVVKPQAAFFEQLGWRGIKVLENIIRTARSRGLLVVLDAKRGDIGSTADAYANAYLNFDAPAEVDAITINPYLGRDSLEPFLKCCTNAGKGIFVLVKTSNPGSKDFQDRKLQNGHFLYEVVAQTISQRASELEGPVTGWSSLGAVVGATFPSEADELRKQLPKSLFLIPGYGAQGGTATGATRGMVLGPNGLEGGIINSSREILYPKNISQKCSLAEWEKALDEIVEKTIYEIQEAVGGLID